MYGLDPSDPKTLDRLRSAVSAERQNPVYQRALANGLLAMGKITDAETVLTERLQHDPADAEAHQHTRRRRRGDRASCDGRYGSLTLHGTKEGRGQYMLKRRRAAHVAKIMRAGKTRES